MTPDVQQVAVADGAIVAVREAVAGWRPAFQVHASPPVVSIGFACHLITLGAACILVDAGLGRLDLPWAQRFAGAFDAFTPGTSLGAVLAARALHTDDVTHVVLTHAHLDHLAGAVCVGEAGALAPRFRRARHFLRAEDFATPRYDGRANPDGDTWLRVLARHGLLETIDQDGEITSGVRVQHTPGESPGHQVVWIERGGECVVHLGDLVHGTAEFEDPERVPAGRDPVRLLASRRRVLSEASRRGALCTFSHARDELFGTLHPLRDGEGFDWSPMPAHPSARA